MTPTRPLASRLVAVVDLGFGDAGKGTTVDWLVRRLGARTVVRFNGGAQAGHNVVTTDGRHHTFAQFGAGTFAGARTHLSEHVVLHPSALVVEAGYLERAGVRAPLERITVDGRALVTTPLQQAAIRLREMARGDGRFGSCGVGVGETMADAIAAPEDAVRARDLAGGSLRARVLRLQARKRAELDAEIRALARVPEARAEVRALEAPDVVDAWIDALAPVRSVVVDEARAREALREGTIVFEGAQGVLLDEWRGFHPYTTWSTCTFHNALAIARDLGEPLARIGVTRTYATRHGPGPFPSETRELEACFDEPHNVHGPWQGAFRTGWLDLVLLRYAMDACGGVDALALTHMDTLARMPRWRVCVRYADRARVELGPARDLAYTEELGRSLRDVEPIALEHEKARCVTLLEEALGARVVLTSRGPTAADKSERR